MSGRDMLLLALNIDPLWRVVIDPLRRVVVEEKGLSDNVRDLKVDCLIIGGGPAGLTAATYLGRFRRNVLLVDNGASRASWIPVTHNLIGYSDGVSGPDLLSRMQKQADQYGVSRIVGEIETLQRRSGEFIGSWQQGQALATTVLIATGGLDVEPQIEDVRSAVKAGLIRHCPICDAFEATGRRIGLVAYGRCRIQEALLLRGYTSDLTVLTLGHPTQLSEADAALLEEAGIKIELGPIERLSREGGKIAAWRGSGVEPLLFDTIYSALGMERRSQLAVRLGAKADNDGALWVDQHQQTSIAGLYAAGDIVHGLSQVSVAAGQAAIAATAINRALPAMKY